jgi:hypothetical protein
MKKFKANAIAFFKVCWYMLKTLKTPRALLSFLIVLGCISGGFAITTGYIIDLIALRSVGYSMLIFWNIIPGTPLIFTSLIFGVLFQKYILRDKNAMTINDIQTVYHNTVIMYYEK